MFLIGMVTRSQSRKLQTNKDTLLAAVTQNGLLLGYASQEFKDDHEVVLAAVTQNGLALRYASNRLQEDKKIVRCAVRQNGLALRYASEAMKGDEDVVYDAVCQNGEALRYASEAMKKDEDIVEEALCQDGLLLRYVSNDLKGDQRVVVKAVRNNPLALQYASEEWKGDWNFVQCLVERESKVMQYASIEAVLQAVQEVSQHLQGDSSKAMQYIGEELKDASEWICWLLEKSRMGSKGDVSFSLEIESLSQDAIRFVQEEVEKNSGEYTRVSVAQDRVTIQKCLVPGVYCNIEFVSLESNVTGRSDDAWSPGMIQLPAEWSYSIPVLGLLPSSLQRNPEIAAQAVNANWDNFPCLEFFDEAMRTKFCRAIVPKEIVEKLLCLKRLFSRKKFPYEIYLIFRDLIKDSLTWTPRRTVTDPLQDPQPLCWKLRQLEW